MDRSSSQIILITGCSSGFGLLSAIHLASKGHTVVATLRNLNKDKYLREEARRANVTLDIQQLDVTDKASIERCVASIIEHHGRLDVVLNNAGYGIGGHFEDLTDEDIRAQMETNFFGVQNVIRAVLPQMRAQEKGRIINMSSVAGFSTSPAFSAYNASKWALEAFSESLHYEVRPFGIHICLIEPGTYKTPIFFENARYAKHYDDPQSPYFKQSQFLKERVMRYVESCRKDPRKVVLLVEHLINHPNPPFRSIPDIESRLMYLLRKFLPFRAYRFLIKTALAKRN